jgi:hypothetical protein
MKCKAGENWGPNIYTCCKCGKTQQLHNNQQVLEICSCGNDEFFLNIVFERSDTGNKNKLHEIIRILEISIFLCEKLNLKAFYNVIAVQLRILLCDSNRILRSAIQKPMLHPHTGERFKGTGDYEVILYTNLFDKTKAKIKLDKWLNQEIIWSKHWEPITIREVIKAWANKNGGAHIDNKLPVREMFVINVSESNNYLLTIAKYVITDLLGCDLENDIIEYLTKPYNRFLNS